MTIKLLITWMALKSALIGSGLEIDGEKIKLHKYAVKAVQTGILPPAVNESSGLAYHAGNQSLYTINDGKIKDFYEISKTGALIATHRLDYLSTSDAEALMLEKDRYLYIGDFGNNYHSRKELRISKFDLSYPQSEPAITSFRYADQTEFPPRHRHRRFDCEAFWKQSGSFYLISKNWGEKTARLYRLSDAANSQVAQPIQKIKFRLPVTDAAFQPADSTVAVLTYGRIYLFTFENEQLKPMGCIKLRKSKQCEALTFTNANTLIYSNEQGKLYEVKYK